MLDVTLLQFKRLRAMNKTIKPRAARYNLAPLCVQIVNCKLSANVAHYAQEPNLVELWQCKVRAGDLEGGIISLSVSSLQPGAEERSRREMRFSPESLRQFN